jgi:arabinofuranosyltransferase
MTMGYPLTGPTSPINPGRPSTVVLALLGLLFGTVLIRTAWISDDAFITLRTVDNLLHGHGLRWNAAERVQTYTHPLWLFWLVPFVWATGSAYFGCLLACFATSSACIFLFAKYIARDVLSLSLGFTILTMSSAFVDYSTGGLENPMTHVLLILFPAKYLQLTSTTLSPRSKDVLILALLACLLTLNRMDAILLVAPALAVLLWRLRSLTALLWTTAGFIPLILWMGFSLFYYGSVFPNTAYAKLNTLIPTGELLRQGLVYFLYTISNDPITLLAVWVGVLLPGLTSQRSLLPVSLGVLLYLLYVVAIGGDFMAGRFLTAPLLVSSIVIVVTAQQTLAPPKRIAAIVTALALGFIATHPTVLSDAGYGANPQTQPIWISGVADERAYYYPSTGLLHATRKGMPENKYLTWGRNIYLNGQRVAEVGSIGIMGYAAGPEVYVIDPIGVADPLLARLPMKHDPYWRVGHYRRHIPEGYPETLETGHNVIADSKLAEFYAKIQLITRGPLFSRDRIQTLLKMNRGEYNHLIDVSYYQNPPPAAESEIPQ